MNIDRMEFFAWMERIMERFDVLKQHIIDIQKQRNTIDGEELLDILELEQKKIAELQKDLPVLKEVVNGTWKKEQVLSDLKTELAAVERKIQLSIKPETDTVAEQPEKAEKQSQHNSETIVRVKGIHLPRGVL